MQILRTILTILFVIDCIALTVVVLMQEGKSTGSWWSIAGAADTYWGKNKGRSMEGGLVKGNYSYGSFVLCTGSCIEPEFLRINWETLLLI